MPFSLDSTPLNQMINVLSQDATYFGIIEPASDTLGFLPHERKPAWLPDYGFAVFRQSDSDEFIYYCENRPDGRVLTFNFFDGVFKGIVTFTRDELLNWMAADEVGAE